jgi:hypothetical protein
MENSGELFEKVKACMARLAEGRSAEMFSPAVLDALRLADLFEDVRPQEYVLPLNAMAGFGG